MKTIYSIANYRTKEVLREFKFNKDLGLSISDYLGRFKIVGTSKLEYSNIKYIKLNVVDPNDSFDDIVKVHWTQKENLINLLSTFIFGMVILIIIGLIKLIFKL